MSDYRGVDYYGIEALLSEEQRMVRDAVREWVEKEFVPIVSQHHRDGTFPIEVAKPLGEMGVFGATSRATAALASTTSPTASSCRSWSGAIRVSAPSPPCKAAS